MPRLPRVFVTNEYYHVYNRGVSQQPIFSDDKDRHHLLTTLGYYQQSWPEQRLSYTDFRLTDREPPYRFEIAAYHLMPNHFHLIVKQTEDRGITRGLNDISNSYTRYFNTKYRRTGHLFEGTFRSKHISDESYLLVLIRYVLLNGYAAGLTNNPLNDPWSSLQDMSASRPVVTHPSIIKQLIPSKAAFNKFITNYADYTRKLAIIKYLLLD